MKKTNFTIIIIIMSFFAFSQDEIINIDINDMNNHFVSNNGCSPFIENPYLNWRVSHGSPNFNGTGIVLAAEGGNQSEGLFYHSTNFKCGHTYNIEFTVGSLENWNNCGLIIAAAKGLTTSKDTICNTGSVPNFTDTVHIFEVKAGDILHYNTISRTIENWSPPGMNYTQLWFLSENEYGDLDSIQISEFKITDNGAYDTIPPSNPSNIQISNINNKYPSLWQDVTFSWIHSTDECQVTYLIQLMKGANQVGAWKKTRTNTITFNNLRSGCTDYYLRIVAQDGSGNQAETGFNFKTTPWQKNIITLNKDFTNKKRTIKEATQKVKLNPGFKFYANPTNEYFIARIAQCSNSKSDSIVQDSVKKYFVSTNIPDTITNQITKIEYNIYPNPTNGIFTLTSNIPENGIIYIFDITGKNIGFYEHNYETIIDISDKKSGIYIVRVVSKSGAYSMKVIFK